MNTSNSDLPLTVLLQKTFMIIGLILFIVFGIATASVAGSHEAARNTLNPQPELQVISRFGR